MASMELACTAPCHLGTFEDVRPRAPGPQPHTSGSNVTSKEGMQYTGPLSFLW